MFKRISQREFVWTIPNFKLASKIFLEESIFWGCHVRINCCHYAHTTRFENVVYFIPHKCVYVFILFWFQVWDMLY